MGALQLSEAYVQVEEMSGAPILPDEVNMVPPMDFEVLDPEPWIRVRVSDGTVIKVRSIVVGVKRLPRKNPDGTGVYVVQLNANIRASENVLKLHK